MRETIETRNAPRPIGPFSQAARATVQVARLPKEVLVEIEAIALA